MVGERCGGANVFGGGYALYNGDGEVVGGLGVSGDTSCADANIGWRVRAALQLDFVPGGVSPTDDGLGDDFIIFDIDTSGFGHPFCLDPRGEAEAAEIIHNQFPVKRP